MQRLLFIGLREGVSLLPALHAAGYVCRQTAPEASDLVQAFDEFDPDALILELAEDALVLDHVRRLLREGLNARRIPLLALIRRQHLDPPHFIAGVDDFLLAPYPPQELLARIQMLFWRFQRANVQNQIQVGDLTLDLQRHLVTMAGDPIPLTQREFCLLQFLMRNRGRAFTRESLLSHVWGYGFEGDVRVVDVYIKRVRSRLSPACRPMLQTVRGVGYRLDCVRSDA